MNNLQITMNNSLQSHTNTHILLNINNLKTDKHAL